MQRSFAEKLWHAAVLFFLLATPAVWTSCRGERGVSDEVPASVSPTPDPNSAKTQPPGSVQVIPQGQSHSSSGAGTSNSSGQTSQGLQPSFTVELAEDGSPTVRLLIRLDYFPAPKPQAPSVPACLDALPADKIVATYSCVEKDSLKGDLKVGAFDQICPANPSIQRVKAASTFTLGGCKKLLIKPGKVEPAIRLDTEPLL